MRHDKAALSDGPACEDAISADVEGLSIDALLGPSHRPGEAQNVRIFATSAQKCFGTGVKLRAFVRGIKE